MKQRSVAAASIMFLALAGIRDCAADPVTDWNVIALQIVSDLPVPPQSRILAMMHVAMYDAVNAIDRRHEVYAVDLKPPAGASPEAAAVAAAHGVLVRVLPQQQSRIDASLATSLAQLVDGTAKADGIALGREVASKLYAIRQSDGADVKVGYTFRSGSGVYQPTPPMNAQPVFPQWRNVTPFMIKSAAQFGLPGPPPAASAAFAKDIEEVKSLGARDSTTRTNEQTATAIFWAVSELLPWNAVARAASATKGNNLVDNARLFAYLNMAVADALIAGFECKYRFDHWRPITAIRGGSNAGNAVLTGDLAWEPLLVTPPHQDYPSGHTLGSGASERVLQSFFGTDQVNATVIWPSLGVSRHWQSFSQIAREVEDARVWAGIHFRTADVHGTELGRMVADYGMNNFLRPVSK